jgi:hypothetical protein
VSGFAHPSVLSGLNNLIDLTFHPNFSAICGFTQEDVGNILDIDKDRALKRLIAPGIMPQGSRRAGLKK